MRTVVYEVMGSVGLILLLAGAVIALINSCCYDVISGFIVIPFIIMMFSALVLIGAAHRKLKD